MKKTYQQPRLQVVSVQSVLMGNASVTGVSSGNVGLTLGGGGSVDARSRGGSDWADEADEAYE